jgi:hypothetical protein
MRVKSRCDIKIFYITLRCSLASYENAGYSRGGVSPTSNGYIDSSDSKAHNIKEMMNHYYNSAYPQGASFWQQGSIDKRFKVGDQTLHSMIYGDNAWYQSRRFYFNLIRRHINMICGYQRKNRKSTITMPNQNDTDPLVDDYNKVLKWSEDRDGFHEYFSQAFEGAMDTGLSMLHLYPDYTLDPISGDLFTDQVSYNNILMDANWRKQDLTDCAFAWRRRWVNKTAAKALLPGHAKEIDKMNVMGTKDGRFPLQAELLNLNVSNLMCYDEFHYRSTREASIILDPKTGEAVEWEPQEDEDPEMLNMIMREQPWLKIKKTQVPTVKLAICLGGKTVYDGENLLRIDSYPMVPLLCYHEPDIQSYAWKIQGIVRNLRDAQYLYNMRKVIELDILQSQINSGWIYPIDAVVDSKAFRQSGQGFLIPLKAGHLPQEIQRVEAPSIPQSMMELSRSLSEDITKISGVNEELLGAATDDKSGILAALRQGAGLVTLQTVFDKADYSQRLYGKIRLQAIRKNFSKGKVQSILGHEPDPRFFTSHSLKYSIAVEEGNYSTTQRQMELQQLLHFKEIGIPISNKSILQAAFITNKKQVIEDMQAEQQAQQQAQQAEQQAQQQVDQSKIMEAYAKSQLDMAKTQESLAKVDEIEGKAQHERLGADLELVKMMIELESLDMETFRKSFEMAQAIKTANSDNVGNEIAKK